MQCDRRYGSQDAAGEVQHFFRTAKACSGSAQSLRELFKVGLLIGRQHRQDVLLDAVTFGHAYQRLSALSYLGTTHFGNRFAGSIARGVVNDAVAGLPRIEFFAEFLKNVFNHDVSSHKHKRKNSPMINATGQTKLTYSHRLTSGGSCWQALPAADRFLLLISNGIHFTDDPSPPGSSSKYSLSASVRGQDP